MFLKDCWSWFNSFEVWNWQKLSCCVWAGCSSCLLWAVQSVALPLPLVLWNIVSLWLLSHQEKVCMHFVPQVLTVRECVFPLFAETARVIKKQTKNQKSYSASGCVVLFIYFIPRQRFCRSVNKAAVSYWLILCFTFCFQLGINPKINKMMWFSSW